MTNRNYRSIRQVRQSIDYDLDQWASSAETSLAVAAAIHAVADSTRSPDAIWRDPTAAEVDHITMAVQEYREHGDFEPVIGEDDGHYKWGEETVYVSPFPVGARVEGGDNADDYDTGRVTGVAGDEITVAWDSGTRTTQPSSVLRSEGSNPHRGD